MRVERYTDGLQAAAEHIVGPAIVDALDGRAEQVVADVTDAPAWPTLRANLITVAAETGEHPLVHLYDAARGRDLSAAEDIAAVLNRASPEPTSTHGRPPLPWLPGNSPSDRRSPRLAAIPDPAVPVDHRPRRPHSTSRRQRPHSAPLDAAGQFAERRSHW